MKDFTVSGTDLSYVTLGFVVFELFLLVCLVYYCLIRPEHKKRWLYIVMIILLMVKNLAMGLFPDSRIESIPIEVQYGLTYGAGFVIASYFPYYFYRAYDLEGLRFHAVRGVFLFLCLPFVLISTTEFLLTGNIDSAIGHGLLIPAAYSLVLGVAMHKSIQRAICSPVKRIDKFEAFGIYWAVIPFVIIAFYQNIAQVPEAIITNIPLIFITCLFIRKDTREARQDLNKLKEIEDSEKSAKEDLLSNPLTAAIFHNNLTGYKLTKRQREVTLHLAKGLSSKQIAVVLNIETATVDKHKESIYKKVGVNRKQDLMDVLMKDKSMTDY